MKFENTDVWGFKHALRGMRNPMNSWKLSDSKIDGRIVYIGPNDMKLAKALIDGGPEHRKFLRQIMVSVDITAPMYWFSEFDTYKVGTTANSTSKMHKLTSAPITLESFEIGDYIPDLKSAVKSECSEEVPVDVDIMMELYISFLNGLREKANDKTLGTEVNKKYWKELVRWLPESWLQTRTVTMNYENLYSMVRQRNGHKLTEWSDDFIAWVRKLPYADELIFAKR